MDLLPNLEINHEERFPYQKYLSGKSENRNLTFEEKRMVLNVYGNLCKRDGKYPTEAAKMAAELCGISDSSFLKVKGHFDNWVIPPPSNSPHSPDPWAPPSIATPSLHRTLPLVDSSTAGTLSVTRPKKERKRKEHKSTVTRPEKKRQRNEEHKSIVTLVTVEGVVVEETEVIVHRLEQPVERDPLSLNFESPTEVDVDSMVVRRDHVVRKYRNSKKGVTFVKSGNEEYDGRTSEAGWKVVENASDLFPHSYENLATLAAVAAEDPPPVVVEPRGDDRPRVDAGRVPEGATTSEDPNDLPPTCVSLVVVRRATPAAEKVPRPKRYLCTHCGVMFRRRSNLERHVTSHALPPTPKRTCRYCGLQFVISKVGDLIHHILYLHTMRSLDCEVCGISFVSSCSLVKHIRVQHSQAFLLRHCFLHEGTYVVEG